MMPRLLETHRLRNETNINQHIWIYIILGVPNFQKLSYRSIQFNFCRLSIDSTLATRKYLDSWVFQKDKTVDVYNIEVRFNFSFPETLRNLQTYCRYYLTRAIIPPSPALSWIKLICSYSTQLVYHISFQKVYSFLDLCRSKFFNYRLTN